MGFYDAEAAIGQTNPLGSTRPTVGRLAPSPTGGLHLGHARTFLLAWLAARRAGGRLVLRIEDIDAARVRPEALAAIVDDLAWFGLDCDDGPHYQSQRTALYAHALERLKAAEAVYPCTCTRADIARAASAPHAADESGPVYPGTCAHRSVADAADIPPNRPYAWRFRAPSRPVAWSDLIRGPMSLDPSRHGGDFVIGRSSGEPAYQLAVVVDDAAMGVTQVVRGDDLIASTPRQILLYRALGFEVPSFAHVPLAVMPDGSRLAKRDGSIKLATLRDQGLDPARLRQELLGSLGQGDSGLNWSRIPTSPWVVPHRWLGSGSR
jgi:glutamyl-tRNA synthetase